MASNSRNMRCKIVKGVLEPNKKNVLEVLINEWLESSPNVIPVNVQPYIPPVQMVEGKRVQYVMASILYQLEEEPAVEPAAAMPQQETIGEGVGLDGI